MKFKKCIFSVSNAKHRLIISLAYAAGLRISEVRDLRVQDIDFENTLLHIKGGKGQKIVLLPFLKNSLIHFVIKLPEKIFLILF